MYLFNKRSLQNLKGVHPTLVKLMKTAILSSPFPFVITEGCRSLERQKQLLKEKNILFKWYFIGDGDKKEEMEDLIRKFKDNLGVSIL